MGLFHKQQSQDTSVDDATKSEEHFFDEYFREELRNHGRWYFEKVINENGDLFKHDLQVTIDRVNTELKEHITAQLDAAIVEVNTALKEHVTKRLEEQLTEYNKSLKEAQDTALESLTHSAQTLQEQHKRLAETLQKNVAEQNALLHDAFDENKSQMIAMKDAQDSALQWLNSSAQALQEQHRKLTTTLEKNVADQETVLVSAFEGNMAQVIEHYLLDAVGEQFDMKAQLPAIIHQMEANKQAIVDDIKL